MIQDVAANSEVRETNNKPVEGFSNIKPETEMSARELNDAVSSEFNNVFNEYSTLDIGTPAKYDDGVRTSNNEVPNEQPTLDIGVPEKYVDDNGKEYRIGDNLLPNTEFVRDGYKYVTDDKGRVVSAEGKLQVKDHEGRKEMDSRSVVDKGDMKPTDDRGHLIADRFNASGGLENLVAMDSKLNQGDYSKLENKLADAVNSGAQVDLKVQPSYEKDSTRPSEFKVTYTIDGEKTVTVFKNESGDKL